MRTEMYKSFTVILAALTGALSTTGLSIETFSRLPANMHPSPSPSTISQSYRVSGINKKLAQAEEIVEKFARMNDEQLEKTAAEMGQDELAQVAMFLTVRSHPPRRFVMTPAGWQSLKDRLIDVLSRVNPDAVRGLELVPYLMADAGKLSQTLDSRGRRELVQIRSRLQQSTIQELPVGFPSTVWQEGKRRVLAEIERRVGQK